MCLKLPDPTTSTWACCCWCSSSVSCPWPTPSCLSHPRLTAAPSGALFVAGYRSPSEVVCPQVLGQNFSSGFMPACERLCSFRQTIRPIQPVFCKEGVLHVVAGSYLWLLSSQNEELGNLISHGFLLFLILMLITTNADYHIRWYKYNLLIVDSLL